MSGNMESNWTLVKIYDEFCGTGIASIVLSILSVAILLYNIGWTLVSRDRRASVDGKVIVGLFSTLLIWYASFLAINVAGAYYYLENAKEDISIELPLTIWILLLTAAAAGASYWLWNFVFCYQMYKAHRPPYSRNGPIYMYALFALGIPVLSAILPFMQKIILLSATSASIVYLGKTKKIRGKELDVDYAHKAHLDSQWRMASSIIMYDCIVFLLLLLASLAVFAFYSPDLEKASILLIKLILIHLASQGFIVSLFHMNAFMRRTTSYALMEPEEPDNLIAH